MIHGLWVGRESSIFGGLGGLGGPKNHSRRWGASPSTFWNGFGGRRGRTDPKSLRFLVGPKPYTPGLQQKHLAQQRLRDPFDESQCTEGAPLGEHGSADAREAHRFPPKAPRRDNRLLHCRHKGFLVFRGRVGPQIVNFRPRPGPTRPWGGLGKASASAPVDLHRLSARQTNSTDIP